jgi:hypothetical protein
MTKQCGFNTLLNTASEKNNQNVSNILHIDRIDLHQSFPTDLLPDRSMISQKFRSLNNEFEMELSILN